MTLKIDVILNDSDRETFTSTSQVRRYLDLVDAIVVAKDKPAQAEVAQAETGLPGMIPSVTQEDQDLTLVPKDGEAEGVATKTTARVTPADPNKKHQRITIDDAIEVWVELSTDEEGEPREVTSSEFKLVLIGKKKCSHTAAQNWVTKLNQPPHNAEIKLDRVRTAPRR